MTKRNTKDRPDTITMEEGAAYLMLSADGSITFWLPKTGDDDRVAINTQQVIAIAESLTDEVWCMDLAERFRKFWIESNGGV